MIDNVTCICIVWYVVVVRYQMCLARLNKFRELGECQRPSLVGGAIVIGDNSGIIPGNRDTGFPAQRNQYYQCRMAM